MNAPFLTRDILGGVRIVVTPDTPKMQLSERVKEVLSPDVIADTNEWMRGFFGMTNSVKDGQVFGLGGGVAYMNPRTYGRIKAAAVEMGV